MMGFFYFKNKSFSRLVKRTVLSIIIPTVIYLFASQILYGWLVSSDSFWNCILHPTIRWSQFGSLLNWNFGQISLSGHLWYLITYVQIILWFPLLRYLAGDNSGTVKARRYVMCLSIIMIILSDIQKVFTFPVGKVAGYSIVPSAVFLVLLGYEIYEKREMFTGNKKTMLGGLGLYLCAHVLLTTLQIILYKRDYMIGHVFSWDSSFAVLGAVGMLFFIFSFDIKGNLLQNIILFIGRNTFYIYLIHLAVICKMDTKGFRQMLLDRFGSGWKGEAAYTIVYMICVFLISLLISALILLIKKMIVRCWRYCGSRNKWVLNRKK